MIIKYTQQKLSFILFILFITIFSFSCIEEFWPNLKSEDEKLLVIEGRISNKPGPYTIKLSNSIPIKDNENVPYSGATVIIHDDQGNTETLCEINPGEYKTSVAGIQGIIGRSYKIEIRTVEGKTYISDFEELPNPTSIESINAKDETKISDNPDEDYERGYQFYITSNISGDEKPYILWNLIETYEYRSKYRGKYIYYGYTPGTNYSDEVNFRPIPYDTLYRCWRTKYVDDQYTFNASYSSSNKIENIPLNFVEFNTEKMRYKYSILVQQLTISEKAYTYFNNLIEHTNQNGLYTNQPYQVHGNVHNPDNEKDYVLGYFLVSGEEEKRLIVTAPEGTNTWINSACFDPVASERRSTCAEFVRKFTDLDLLPVIVVEWHFANFPPEEEPSLWLPRQTCVNCTLKGGVDIKPDYWDQEN